MSTTYNISVFQGENIDFTLNLKENNGTTPLNLSGYSVRGKVKYSYGSSGILWDLNPTILSAVSGQISLSIPATGIANLPVTEAVYDIERYTTNDTIVKKVLMGKFIVKPEVTS
jgi:hypothetical protein